jgi:hypothetical protein
VVAGAAVDHGGEVGGAAAVGGGGADLRILPALEMREMGIEQGELFQQGGHACTLEPSHKQTLFHSWSFQLLLTVLDNLFTANQG